MGRGVGAVLVQVDEAGLRAAAVQVAQCGGLEVVLLVRGDDGAGDGLGSGLQHAPGAAVHVVEAGSPRLEEELRAATGGRPLAGVLRCSGAEVPEAVLAALGTEGRMVAVGGGAQGEGQRRAFTLAELSEAQIAVEFERLSGWLEAGRLQPRPPVVFEASKVAAAMRHVRAGSRRGPVVLAVGAASRRSLAGAGEAAVITGGYGALGLALARHLASCGARRIVLVGRRGLPEDSREVMAELEALGSEVVCERCDVGDRGSVAGLLQRLGGEGAPGGPGPAVGALYHAAGELDDRLLVNQSRESLQRAFQAKVHGSWNLHEATAGLGLRRFVLFSSIAAVFGARGQGNYAAGNAFMDSLAHYRRHVGLPAVSINWGAWAGAGMASDVRAMAAIRSQGVGFLDVEGGLRGLEYCLAEGAAQVVFAAFDSSVLRNVLLHRLHPRGTSPAGALGASRRAVPEAPTVMQGVADPLALQALLAGRVAAVLGMSAAALDAEVPLQTYGMDSLMSMELRNAVGSMLGVKLSGTLLFDYPTISALAAHLWERFQPAEAGGGPAQRLGAGAAGDVGAVAAAGMVRVGRAAVAITGMACRFPRCGSAEEYWAFIEAGQAVDAVVPASRRGNFTFYDDEPEMLPAALLDDIDLFDPLFFNISPVEAESMDPQQRLLLELSWLALEDAGIVPGTLMNSRAGVYVGICSSEFAFLSLQASGSALPTGLAMSVASGRLSYFFGARGPCVSIDTACSSSLVAMHLAVQALRKGDSDMAIVGGANGIFTSFATAGLQRMNALSPTCRCATFDASADGYQRAEGVAAVVVERQEGEGGVLRTGRRAVAVVCGSAVNQDGRSNGLTAPTGPAQEALIREALGDGGLVAAEVSYLECHGTGTRLGDPIEVQALGQAYGERRAPDNALVLGAVKANIGHSEGAAGLAGVVKVVLCIEHGVLPPVARFRQLNPNIRPLEEIPAVIPLVSGRWEAASGRRVAGVSSFAFSGTNAHAIIAEPAMAGAVAMAEEERGAGGAEREEEGAGDEGAQAQAQAHVLCLTAYSRASLEGLAGRYAELLERPGAVLGDVCHSARATRTVFRHRLAVAGTEAAEVAGRLRGVLPGALPGAGAAELSLGDAGPRGRRRVALAFTGQGAQYVGMGQALYRQDAGFARWMDHPIAGLLPSPPLCLY